jgi:hypothetical protein
MDVVYTKDGEQSQMLIWPGAVIDYGGSTVNNIQFLPGTQPGKPYRLEDMTEMIENSINNLEYMLISSIKRSTIKRQPRIAFLQGHGELTFAETQIARALISNYYSIADITLNDSLAAAISKIQLVRWDSVASLALTDTAYNIIYYDGLTDYEQKLADLTGYIGGLDPWASGAQQAHIDKMKELSEEVDTAKKGFVDWQNVVVTVGDGIGDGNGIGEGDDTNGIASVLLLECTRIASALPRLPHRISAAFFCWAARVACLMRSLIRRGL